MTHSGGVAFEHESFWVAVAAASPIIALANQITLTDALSGLGVARAVRVIDFGDYRQRLGGMSRLAAFTSYFVGGANLFAQTAALGIALVSLANSEDAFSWAVPFALTLEVVGLIAIGTTAAFSGLIRGEREEWRRHRDEPPKGS